VLYCRLEIVYLGPAMSKQSNRFPNETTKYRSARDELLKLENELTQQVWKVAAARRKLPPGGKLKTDYEFDEVDSRELSADEPVRKVKLSELFLPGKDTLILYSYMYGPKMGAPCPMCTSFLDSLNGTAPHVMRQVGLAVVARSPIARIRGFARGRKWKNLRLLSSANNTYNKDYFGELNNGEQQPMMNVFKKKGRTITHFWGTEQLFVSPDPKADSCHLDLMWPLWNVLDVTPSGRGKFYPEISY
jgi:predicted dithiol-disulfide oxidoreductase (DUF899 family)